MSKLDFPTILILAICIAAIVFLGYKMFDLLGKNKEQPAVETPTEIVEEEEESANESESDTYSYDLDEADSLGTSDMDTGAEPGSGSEDGISYSERDTEQEATEDDIPSSFSSSSSGKYLVLAGAFKIRANAESHARKLHGLGYDDAEAKIFDRGSIAVVLVDRFETLGEAKSLVTDLKKNGVEAYVQNQKGATE